MKLGILPPVVQRNPRFSPPPWEEHGGPADLAAIAGAADRLGYAFLAFPNHVAIPAHVAPIRGGTYWDPVATMAYLAAHTERIRLAAYVVVLGYYHPLQVAKSFGTVDRLSGGRLILAVGVGSLREEFELLGVPFEGRGERADDALRALRSSLSTTAPRYEGDIYRYDGWVLDPCAVQERVPIWVGGRTLRSLRRALEGGDGWAPFGLPLERLEPLIESRRDAIGEREAPFDLVLAPEPPLDPAGDPSGTAETIRRYRSAGATALTLRFRHRSLEHYLDQLEAMMRIPLPEGP